MARTAAVILVVAVGRQGAAAVPATPAPAAPPPALCTAQPRSVAEIDALLAAPPIAPTPVRAGGDVIPAGTSADPSTSAAIDATVREWVACQNAGEPLRSYRLFTDAYLRRLLGRQGPFSPAAADALATPMPAAAKRAAIAAIGPVRLLPDGRAGALVTLTYPAVPMPKTFFFTFVKDGDVWRIDGILGEISFSVP